MSKIVLFLRGVNVGGVKVLMKDLSALLANAGYTQVRTLLASGNVVLDPGDAGLLEVQQRCNELLEAEYGRSIPTLAYSAKEIIQLGGPFPLDLPEPVAEHHGYLTLCESQAHAQQLLELAREAAPEADLALTGRALCWIVRKGQSTTDPLSKLHTSQARKQLITTRNHNTLVKLASIVQ
ncbi:hypothetical protein AUR04nite_27400 [Glutamicibacter uratoxydans]|uniref:Uncharacterized protein n=1 Tax=Glutamicibacter uratoxydans TaxID=43667 RepID=A0A4Y4DV16_GLUUR|nr:DUF1697 domain-containing protein [Glutamicibacter uratoxydans]GED07208.1 hypothetical protein AUR04nite_27400 [Glutamicibacter uratoxydans]